MKPNEYNEEETNSEQMSPTQQAAANILRSKIDAIYDSGTSLDPYNKTHTKIRPESSQLEQYHSAWQNYYNKYYEGYYSHKSASSSSHDGYFTGNDKPVDSNEPITEKKAMDEIRDKLLSTVSHSAEKVRKSRHFMPLLAGFVVVLLFLLVQYNGLIMSKVLAYISPGNIDVQNIVIDPSTEISVNPDPRLIIPKINVDVPVMYDISNEHSSLMNAMENGVAHFAVPGASSHPGQVGNTVISGHSTNDLLSSGDYKFIFVQLEKLVVGDIIYANYQSKRYTYIVTETKVVGPNDVDSLIDPTDKPLLTLITCVPIGTAKNRLLVVAEQVSPDPATSAEAPEKNSIDKIDKIPGIRPTLIEWMFGKRD